MNSLDLFNKYIEYDHIIDLWYSWLYSRLHFLLSKEVIQKFSPKNVLDIGCGTGFQSFLHYIDGSRVVGIDSSVKMIKIAQRKMGSLNQSNRLMLFPEEFDFVKKYNELITTLIIQHGNYHYEYPKFLVSDLYHLPFKNDKFDHINCCGSVLGLVRDIDSALLEMSRLLKVEGTLFIEVDSRWSLDTLWMMLDYFLLHKLGFYTSRNDVNKIIFSSILKDIIVDYPYGEYEGFQDKNYKIKLKLFSPFALQKKFCLYNFKVLKKWNIHSITNLLPSTILDKDNPSNTVKKIFTMLSSIEEKMPNLIPGCSTVYLLKKT